MGVKVVRVKAYTRSSRHGRVRVRSSSRRVQVGGHFGVRHEHPGTNALIFNTPRGRRQLARIKGQSARIGSAKGTVSVAKHRPPRSAMQNLSRNRAIAGAKKVKVVRPGSTTSAKSGLASHNAKRRARRASKKSS